jgi:4-amino-4-deoxy-L-arabinose transferase-like glycosyltransferase
LWFSVLVVIGTELTSAFHSFDRIGLGAFWSLTAVGMMALPATWRNRRLMTAVVADFRSTLSRNKWSGYLLLVLFLVTFLQGLVYPPNNYDSMAYHMARVAHWFAHGEVNYYVTGIYRQIFQPPFAEWLIGHICILAGNDWFANAVQLLYLAGIVTCTMDIGRRYRLTKPVVLFGVFYIVTTPGILLEATSTQNDLVVSFFTLLAGYYAIESVQAHRRRSAYLMALSAGLAALTKGTGYVFVFPILLAWFGYWVFRTVRYREYQQIIRYGLVPMVFLLVSAGYIGRNLTLSGHIFGSFKEGHFNERIGLATTLSSFIKNSALHYGVYPFNEVVESTVHRVHDWLGEDVNDPDFNWIHYGTDDVTKLELTKWMHHEDDASNIIQYTLFLLAGILAFARVRKDPGLWAYLLIFAGYLMFCAMLKWQPWNSKLHNTYFVLWALPTGYALRGLLRHRLVTGTLAVTAFLYAALVLVFNPNRPFIRYEAFVGGAGWTDSRSDKYFSAHLGFKHDMRDILGRLGTEDFSTIGFVAGERHEYWEYPFYEGIFGKSDPKTFHHINVENPSAGATDFYEDKAVSKIVAYRTLPSIRYGGKEYIRKTDNEFINLYVPAE